MADDILNDGSFAEDGKSLADQIQLPGDAAEVTPTQVVTNDDGKTVVSDNDGTPVVGKDGSHIGVNDAGIPVVEEQGATVVADPTTGEAVTDSNGDTIPADGVPTVTDPNSGVEVVAQPDAPSEPALDNSGAVIPVAAGPTEGADGAASPSSDTAMPSDNAPDTTKTADAGEDAPKEDDAPKAEEGPKEGEVDATKPIEIIGEDTTPDSTAGETPNTQGGNVNPDPIAAPAAGDVSGPSLSDSGQAGSGEGGSDSAPSADGQTAGEGSAEDSLDKDMQNADSALLENLHPDFAQLEDALTAPVLKLFKDAGNKGIKALDKYGPEQLKKIQVEQQAVFVNVHNKLAAFLASLETIFAKK